MFWQSAILHHSVLYTFTLSLLHFKINFFTTKINGGSGIAKFALVQILMLCTYTCTYTGILKSAILQQSKSYNFIVSLQQF